MKPRNSGKHYTIKQLEYIYDLHNFHNMSIYNIAKKFNRTENGIRYALKKYESII